MQQTFELEPSERLFIGNSVLTNSHDRAMFVLEGETPVLRAKDVICSNAPDNFLEMLYLCVQRMYLERDIPKYERYYRALVDLIVTDDASVSANIETSDQLITIGETYNALKNLKKLIRPEAFAVR